MDCAVWSGILDRIGEKIFNDMTKDRGIGLPDEIAWDITAESDLSLCGRLFMGRPAIIEKLREGDGFRGDDIGLAFPTGQGQEFLDHGLHDTGGFEDAGKV